MANEKKYCPLCQALAPLRCFLSFGFLAPPMYIGLRTKTITHYTRFSMSHRFTRESSCFQRVLAIAILSVCPSNRPSATRVDQSKEVQPRITKSSPSGAWKTLVSGTVKLFYKFEGGYPERRR